VAKVVANMAVAIKVIKDISPGVPKFDDSGMISDWAKDYIYTAQIHGWMEGYGGKVDPLRNITRAETVKMFNCMLGRIIDGNSIAGIDYIRYSDLPDTDHWAFYHLVEASNDHSYTMRGNKEYWVKKQQIK